jgi:hypothetical protein
VTFAVKILNNILGFLCVPHVQSILVLFDLTSHLMHRYQSGSSDVRFEVFTAVTMKNAVFLGVRRVALVRTDVSVEHRASFISATRISELGTMLAVTRNRPSVASYS